MDASTQYLYKSCMQQSPYITNVQNYNLFGEGKELPDVVHCESIATRSVLHNWEFSPHRHTRLHQVILIQKGRGRAELEGQIHDLSASLVVNVPIGCVHAFSFRRGTQGWVITLGEEILDESLKESEGVRQILSQAGIFQSTNDIQQLIRGMSHEHANLEFARAQILRAMSGLLMGHIARVIVGSRKALTTSLETSLQRRFEALIDTHYLDHWCVAEYADILAVTPGHLSRVMRQSSGLSASRIIEFRVVREARRYLAYTNLTISEIAYALGFIDPAYFSRVFSRSTGKSPRKFRSNLE